ncbi:Uncharacterised protein [Kingella potus]|uniref:Knr4/Smi1-like domain-containing protein n=1 Tax=Kingella potus TaxID=265175 RepID=A0A377QZW0_9NEIS|nr:hypothetical protein [Kingella potus]UOP01309.1 hypothetical protein LVJ84_03395 [Kingella potus]STR00379.1 Uncharacterised protein [Kingella potus]
MNNLPQIYCGYPVPADYRAFAQSLAAERRYDYPLHGTTFDLSLLPAAELVQIYLGKLPRYAFLQTVDFFKPLEFDCDSPKLGEEEVRHGLVIGSGNEGDLFINVHDGSVWIMYSDLFFERIANSFAALSAKMVLSFDFADWRDDAPQ